MLVLEGVRMCDNEKIKVLEKKSEEIRKQYLEYVSNIGRSHVGGCLSMCEVVVALHYEFMNWMGRLDKNTPNDKFILSKGHCSELLYLIYSDVNLLDREKLVRERLSLNGKLSGHADRRYLPMIDFSTGALGHGLSVAAGCAKAATKENKYNVYCVLGDGELQEGSNWEAFMFAAHHKLGNLIVIVDRNGYSSCCRTEDVVALQDLKSKLDAFGFDVYEINGNSMREVYNALSLCLKNYENNKPKVIISNTIKGYGLREAMEHPEDWHHNAITKEMIG